MSELIKHECAIILIRLLKPLEYYQRKYGTWRYGLNKAYLLMEKQHNRGQDGAGLVNLKLDVPPGKRYLHRVRSNESQPIKEVFNEVNEYFSEADPVNQKDGKWAKENVPFAGELYMGHLRYGTFGKNSIENIHPVMRENNWKSRNLVLAGNFNLTNVDELFNKLVDIGQHPKEYNDTVTILENIGHFLDEENDELVEYFKQKGYSKKEITPLIARDLNVQKILKESSKNWDGGFVIGGMVGHGDAFVYRDPFGIRPAYYYTDDEIAVVASERPVIQTALNVKYNNVKEVTPGHALIIKSDGRISESSVSTGKERKSCSFERIYFSRGSDRDIYLERKNLGKFLSIPVLDKVNWDMENTVFSYIPNTSETAFLGMMEGIRENLNSIKKEKIQQLGAPPPDKELDQILNIHPRIENMAVKDVKLRTFISEDEGRDDLVSHVYDVTYGIVRRGLDTLVIIDDSIVRGTTLKQSIIRILDRLGPKKIVVVSSSPQIRYPDCYGIDMAKLGDFIAFRAAISLLYERNMRDVITEVYNKSLLQKEFPKEEIVNYVKEIYAPFTYKEISDKIAELLTSENVNADVEILYQSIEDLHRACPKDKGDWYFTGNYPTPGGNRVVNNSFINFIEEKDIRGY